MKKNAVYYFLPACFLFFCLAAGAVFGEETKKGASGIGFSLKFWGGGGLLFDNQFNDHIRSENTINGRRMSLVVDSEHPLMRTVSNLGAEFILDIGRRLGVGFGVGYFMAKKGSPSEMTMTVEPGEVTSTYSPKITALPLTMSFIYRLPVGERFRLNAFAGLGFYYGKIYFRYKNEWSSPVYETGSSSTDWTANSDSLGFHGGLEMEWNLIPGVALNLSVSAQRAVFTELIGDLDWTEFSTYYGIDDSGTEENLTLWFGEEIISGDWYTRLFFEEDEPAGAYVRNVEKAKISMANVSLLFGIKILLKK